MVKVFIFSKYLRLFSSILYLDMYANEPGDPKELVDARARIGELVGKWIDEAN